MVGHNPHILGLPKDTDILETDLPMGRLLLLDVFPNHLYTTEQCYILHVLLMIARKLNSISLILL